MHAEESPQDIVNQRIRARQRTRRTTSMTAIVFACVLTFGLTLIVVLYLLGVRTTSFEEVVASDPLPIPVNAQEMLGLGVGSVNRENSTYFSNDVIFADTLLEGQSAAGQPMVYARFTEAGLNQYAHYWFVDDFVGDEPRIQRVHLQLQPGKLVITATVDLELGQQKVAVHFRQLEDSTQFVIEGYEVGEVTLRTAPESFIGQEAAEFETWLNNVLTTVRIENSSEQPLPIREVRIDYDNFEMLAVGE